MSASRDGTAVAQQPYVLHAGEGDARRVLAEVATIKATPAQTGGAFALKETREIRGDSAPLHVHTQEDEGCYVLDGDLTFFVGEDVIRATAGDWIYLPRGVPHAVRVNSEEARTLWIVVPGAFMSFFAETFPPADADPASNPQPDLERLAAAAAAYGVTLLGPTPKEESR
jgi:quercetin dioxygenase-like cupin family protein